MTYEIISGSVGGHLLLRTRQGRCECMVGEVDKEAVDQYTLTILAEDVGESCCRHFPCCLSCGSVGHSCYWSTCNTVAVGVFAVSRGGP